MRLPVWWSTSASNDRSKRRYPFGTRNPATWRIWSLSTRTPAIVSSSGTPGSAWVTTVTECPRAAEPSAMSWTRRVAPPSAGTYRSTGSTIRTHSPFGRTRVPAIKTLARDLERPAPLAGDRVRGGGGVPQKRHFGRAPRAPDESLRPPRVRENRGPMHWSPRHTHRLNSLGTGGDVP